MFGVWAPAYVAARIKAPAFNIICKYNLFSNKRRHNVLCLLLNLNMQGMSLAFSYDEAKDASPNNHHANYDELRKYIFILIPCKYIYPFYNCKTYKIYSYWIMKLIISTHCFLSFIVFLAILLATRCNHAAASV